MFDARGLHVLPASSTRMCISASRAISKRRIWKPELRRRCSAALRPSSKCPTPTRRRRRARSSKTSSHERAQRMHCDHAFYVGASSENIGALSELERLPGVAGVKAFLGSSTGSLLLDKEEAISNALKSGRRRMAVHSEDEARLKERAMLAMPGDPRTHPVWRDVETARRSTERVLRLARAAGRRLHLLHDSTAEELPLLADARDIATVESRRAASDARRTRVLRAPRHLCADQSADPRRASSRGAVARGAQGLDRCRRLRPRAAYARRQGRDLSPHGVRPARRADAGHDHARPCECRAPDARTFCRSHAAPDRRACSASPARAALRSATTPISPLSISRRSGASRIAGSRRAAAGRPMTAWRRLAGRWRRSCAANRYARWRASGHAEGPALALPRNVGTTAA